MTEEKSKMRVAVGMSGGIDSSAAAALLIDQGCEVIGVTACLWSTDVSRALKVAEHLGIRHHVVEAEEFFKERIVDPFVNEYAQGRTPSPCVECNRLVKFGVLLRKALEMGCTHIATGHYAQLERQTDGWRLLRGRDAHKDQSYFLHRLGQEQMTHVLFPVGTMTKPEVIDYARQRKLPVEYGSESQDLCFIPDGGYASFLEKMRPALKKEGVIVDVRGKELGRHGGFHRFTVGQREGIGVASKTRLYVKEVRAESNVVVVGTHEEAMSRECLVKDVHWIAEKTPVADALYSVRLRYRHKGSEARIEMLDGERMRVVFTEPQFAVTPGQAAVVYRGDEVLGGGWIEST